MTDFFKGIRTQIGASILMLVLATSLLHAQTTRSNSEEKVLVPQIEKIYVHTDKTCYTLGESLWYKAYSVYAYNNLLFDNSKVLYVELIAPDSKIIARNKTKLEGGLGHGDFKLKDSIGVKAGVYQIRAYTNYSRNFGYDFVFKKEIEIINVFDKLKEKTKASNSTVVNKRITKNAKNAFKVQFFPEGGSLINNIQSVVAFKAVDNYGNPLTAQGKVYDSNGDIVTFFGSLHDGMGKFEFKPLKGMEYHVVMTSNGNQIKVPLPTANEKGYLLSLKKLKGKHIATIKTNQKTLSKQSDSPLTIIFKTRGITYFEGTNQLTETSLSFGLPDADFPEGISQITLYDADLKPQSERLVFIKKENDIQVTLLSDKKTYKPNEKVTVNIASKTKLGKGVPASFSLSGIDMNGVNNAKNHGTNIASYFLMQSDIKGKVHNPGYYFDASNPRRLAHLDLLLLTQGWRDFLWKQIPEVDGPLVYNPEKGFTISGSVKQLLGDKAKENNTVNLTLFSGFSMSGHNTVTDSIGRFKFDTMSFMGKTKIFLNTKNKRGKSTGRIELDSLTKPPMHIDFKALITPEYTPTTNIIKETIYKKYVMNGVAPENVLDAVEIVAKKKNYLSNFGMVEFTYEAGEEDSPYLDIFQLIQSEVPGVDIIYNDSGNQFFRFPRFSSPALITINDVPIIDAPNYISSILPNEIAKINVYKSQTSQFGSQGANGVISIYLKRAGDYKTTKEVFHSMTKNIEGFYDARVFYSTDPNSPDFENDNTLAVRNTLYWNPYIHPDENGDSQVTYFNTEVQTNVKLTLEGVTATGIPVVIKTNYTIQK